MSLLLRSLRAARPALQTLALQPSRAFASVQPIEVSRTAPSVFGVTGKIATKLFEESQKANNLAAVRSELKTFRDLYEQNAHLRTMIINPVSTSEERSEQLSKVFAEAKINTKEAQSFIQGAAATKNIGRIKQIVNDFDKLVTYELKEVPAVVVSAEPLSSQQVSRLEAALKARIPADRKLLLTTKVEPTILGGLVINLDQQQLDLSVKQQIRKIDAALKA